MTNARYTATIAPATDRDGQHIEGFVTRAASASEALAKAKTFFASMGVTSPRFLSLKRQEVTQRRRQMPAVAAFTDRYSFVPRSDAFGVLTPRLTSEA